MPYRHLDTGEEWPTKGEAYVGHELRREKRAGVDHYVAGQIHAKLEQQEDPNIRVALLDYTTAMGAVAIVPCVSVFGGEWEPALHAARFVGLDVDFGPRQLPEGWKLTDEMRAALKEAEER